MQKEASLLGMGIYSIADASRLTMVSPSRIRRWMKGYGYTSGQAVRHQPPICRSKMPPSGEALTVDFQDLCVIRIVNAFIEAGASLQQLRKVDEKARAELGSPHPLLTEKFKVVGRRIFGESSGQHYEFLTNQAHFSAFIDPYLKDVDFKEDEVLRWWPLGRDREVVIDPAYCFGRPIIAKLGVLTQVLAQAVKAEGSVHLVSQIYDVPERAVRDAMTYESSLAA